MDGVIEGWCWCPDRPEARATIVIKLDGIPVASARCDAMRPDLAAAGISDGASGFLLIVDDLTLARPDAWVSLHDCETGRLLGSPRTLGWRRLTAEKQIPTAPIPKLIEGNLDGVSSDGVVSGWCWQPLDFERRVSVTIAIDGQVVGTALAANARPDLAKANIGDGAHGFSFALSTAMLATTGQLHVSVADAATGQGFGVPCVARLGQLAATQDRLADIEHLIRRLGADLAALLAEDSVRPARTPTTDLFASLGTLFQNMAQSRTAPSARHLLEKVQADVRAGEGDLTLAVSTHPKATVIVPVGDDLAEISACLRHLHAQGTDRHAEIILLDRGTASAPEILHTKIRNLRIASDHEADLGGWIARLSRPDVPIIYLAPVLRPGPFWLDHLLAAHRAHPNAAIVGGHVVGAQDGLLRSAGIDAVDGDIPRESGQLERADTPAFRCLRRVEAVSALAFLIAPDAVVRPHPGENIVPQGLAEAVLHLCLHQRQAGRDILIQPAAIVFCADVADLHPHMPDVGCDAVLQAAWSARPRLVPPIGQILVIDDHLPQSPGRVSSCLSLLREAGFAVTFAATSAMTRDADAEPLERQGIAVFRAHEAGSISAMLLSHTTRYDIIAFMANQPSTPLIERARLLVSHARIIQIASPERAPSPFDETELEAAFWQCHDRAFGQDHTPSPR